MGSMGGSKSGECRQRMWIRWNAYGGTEMLQSNISLQFDQTKMSSANQTLAMKTLFFLITTECIMMIHISV